MSGVGSFSFSIYIEITRRGQWGEVIASRLAFLISILDTSFMSRPAPNFIAAFH